MVPLFLLACNRPLASALVSSLGVPGHLRSGTVPLLDNCWAVPAGLEPFSAAGTIQARATALTGGVLQRAHVALFLLDARWGTSERPTAQGRHPQPRRGCFHICYAGCALLPAAAPGLHATPTSHTSIDEGLQLLAAPCGYPSC